MLLVRRLLGIHRLQRDPYAVEGRGARPQPRCPAPDRPCQTTIIAARGLHRRALAGTAAVPVTCCRGWPAPGRRCERPLGVEDRTPTGAAMRSRSTTARTRRARRRCSSCWLASSVRATFFLVGEQVRRNPSLAREIVAAGHEIALHCDRHRNLLRLTPRQVREDLDRAHETIVAATGASRRSTARPTGSSTPPRCARRASAGGGHCCGATGGATGRRRATRRVDRARVTDGADEGSVLLLHDADDYSAPDSWRRTAAALPRVLETMRERGLEPVFP